MGLRLERHTTWLQSFGFCSQGMLGKAGPKIVGDVFVLPKGFAFLSQLFVMVKLPAFLAIGIMAAALQS
jgi:hypothetical protein